MRETSDPFEQRLDELAELFAPAKEVYGEGHLGLFDDEDLCARIRNRFECASSFGRFPILSEHLSNLSAKEKEMFFRTGGLETIVAPFSLVPEDVGLRFRRLQHMLRRQPEFQARFPEAFEILFSNEARNNDRIGLPLPSFGIRVLLNEPRAWTAAQDQYRGGDAHAHTQDPEAYQGSKHVARNFWPVHEGYLRGILLAVLSREEYAERIRRFAWDEDLMHGVKTPEESAIRITDLRLATALKPGVLRRGLEQALSSLQRPLSAKRVSRWKVEILGSKLEDPSASSEQMAKVIENIPEEDLPEDRRDSLKRIVERSARTTGKPFEPVLAQTVLLKQCFGTEHMGTMAISFTAAALLLFLDLDTPGMNDEAPCETAERIEALAETVQKLARALERSTTELDKLTSGRTQGGQRRPLGSNYRALTEYRMGRDLKKIAEDLGITPYDSANVQGSTNWRRKVERAIAKGKKVEDEHYPRAAAIFRHRENPHVRRKARRAYRVYQAERKRDHSGFCSYQTLARYIRTGSPRKDRGQEIADAYLQLGSCILQRIRPLP